MEPFVLAMHRARVPHLVFVLVDAPVFVQSLRRPGAIGMEPFVLAMHRARVPHLVFVLVDNEVFAQSLRRPGARGWKAVRWAICLLNAHHQFLLAAQQEVKSEWALTCFRVPHSGL